MALFSKLITNLEDPEDGYSRQDFLAGLKVIEIFKSNPNHKRNWLVVTQKLSAIYVCCGARILCHTILPPVFMLILHHVHVKACVKTQPWKVHEPPAGPNLQFSLSLLWTLWSFTLNNSFWVIQVFKYFSSLFLFLTARQTMSTLLSECTYYACSGKHKYTRVHK